MCACACCGLASSASRKSRYSRYARPTTCTHLSRHTCRALCAESPSPYNPLSSVSSESTFAPRPLSRHSSSAALIARTLFPHSVIATSSTSTTTWTWEDQPHCMAMTDDSSSLRVVQPNNSTSRSTSPRQPSSLPQSRPQPPTEQQQQAGERPPASPTSYAFSAPYPMAPAPTSPRQRPSNGIHDPSSFFQLPRYSFPPNLVPVQPSAPGIRRHPSYKTPANSPSSGTSPPRIPYPSSNGSISHVTETHHITKDYDHRTGAKTINRYEFHETIGRGVHGKVKLARDTETGEPMAIKIVNRISKKRLGRMDPLEAESKVRREIAIMKKCVHPNVVALREVMDDPNSKKIYLGTPQRQCLSNVSTGVHGRRSTTMARRGKQPRPQH